MDNNEEFVTSIKSLITENMLDTIPADDLMDIFKRAKSIADSGNRQEDSELSAAIATILREIESRGVSLEKKIQITHPYEKSSSAKSISIWLIAIFIVAAGSGILWWYTHTNNAGFDIEQYETMILKMEQVQAIMRQQLKVPEGDLIASFRGTAVEELLQADKKFYQDLSMILSKGGNDCSSVPDQVESLQQQYMRNREPLARRIELNQINPLLGMATMQTYTEQAKALKPYIESFMASCPHESGSLNFLLAKDIKKTGK